MKINANGPGVLNAKYVYTRFIFDGNLVEFLIPHRYVTSDLNGLD